MSLSSLMSTLSAISGKGLTFASSLYRPDMTFWSISVETESVVFAESRSRMVCSRLMAMDLLLPPPPPPPPLPLKTPQPGTASMAAPARPVPLIFKKSLRDIPGPRRTPSPFFSISSILTILLSQPRVHGAGVPNTHYMVSNHYTELRWPRMFRIPETLYLRSIRASLTIMQFCGPTGLSECTNVGRRGRTRARMHVGPSTAGGSAT